MSHPAELEKKNAEDHNEVPTSLETARGDISNSFLWYARAAEQELNRLRADLKVVDPPPWDVRLADAMLEVALELGAVAAGHFLGAAVAKFAMKAMKGNPTKALGFTKYSFTEDSIAHGASEFFKTGIQAGIKAGHGAHHRGAGASTIDRFIDGQVEGVDHASQANQRHFNNTFAARFTDLPSVIRLWEACMEGGMKGAAAEQYAVSRNAWVSYLAQSSYGSFGRAGGQVTTNMTTDAVRARVNERAPDVVPNHDPTPMDALVGNKRGVLTVIAHASGFGPDGHDQRAPRVEYAFLAGVNSGIRKQYGYSYLEDCPIPRQVSVSIDPIGRSRGFSSFVANVDETGNLQGLEGEPRWLEANANAHPTPRSASGAVAQRGLSVLLGQLVLRDIEGPI
jgi:hypothetical protein